ncbi:MAG: hypothetical protein KY467_04980 [Gemmatimonadetes bacterium]|nr:hypothetical protein [Gemmatimonadota bacterium]
MHQLGDLEVVDGLKLPARERQVLRPGELVRGRDGFTRRLPRWFYRVPSWEVALEVSLAPHFKLWEFLDVDVREHELLRVHGPRYVPLAVTLLAAALEAFRREVNTYVHISANGGYRSPAHGLSGHASVHCWGVAANLYRVGDDLLDDVKNISRYSDLAREVFPAFQVLPFGSGVGETDDHLHLDVGYAVVTPHGMGDEEADKNAGPLPGGGAEARRGRKGGA